MATKLVRLINDQRKSDQSGGGGGRKRDLETEDLIEEMQDKIRNLDKQNTLLKEKLVATKQQLAVHTKRISFFNHTHNQPASRLNTGGSKASGVQYGNSERAYSPSVINYRVSGPQDRGNHYQNDDPIKQSRHNDDKSSLKIGKDKQYHSWEEISIDNNYGATSMRLKDENQSLAQENSFLKQTLKEKQQLHDEEILSLKSQVNQNEKQTVYENIEIIKLQRETKEAQDKMMTLLDQYNALQENYQTSRANQERLVREIDHLTYQLREEQQQRLRMQRDTKDYMMSNPAITELKEQTNGLQKEVNALKESNLKLINSAIHFEKEHHHHDLEAALRFQIAKLEDTVKGEMESKLQALLELSHKKEDYRKQEESLKNAQKLYQELKVDYETFVNKMTAFSEIQAEFPTLTKAEVIEAFEVVKKEKEMDFIITAKIDELKASEAKLQEDISRLESENLDLKAADAKQRTLMEVQYNISNEYKNSLDLVTNELDRVKEELTEKNHLLDIRISHISRLEEQLNDIAWGTSSKGLTKTFAEVETKAPDKIPSFVGEENVFEIHIKQVFLNSDGLMGLQNQESATFLTWIFYDYELMSTPIGKGLNPIFNCSAKYAIMTDELFLHYLNKEPMIMDYHEIIGNEYSTIGTAQIRFRELLDLSSGCLHASVPLINEMNTVIGNVDYWVALEVPLPSATQFYKERCKAISYLKGNQMLTEQALSLLDENIQERKADYNILSVNIIQANDIQSLRNSHQPSAYCMYKFYTLPDHDSIVITSSNNPIFHDHKIYHVNMDEQLDKYMQSQSLDIYVFDDDDPSDIGFLGVATVPLISLSKNLVIEGSFHIKQYNGAVNGTLDVLMKWQFPFSNKQAVSAQNNMKDNHILDRKTSAQALIDDENKEIVSHLININANGIHIKPPVAPRGKSLAVSNTPVQTTTIS